MNWSRNRVTESTLTPWPSPVNFEYHEGTAGAPMFTRLTAWRE